MKRSLVVLLLYLGIFVIMFGLSLYTYHTQKNMVDIGLPGQTTNIMILMLSVIAIFKTVYHIFRH